jgi:hypothetical protein
MAAIAKTIGVSQDALGKKLDKTESANVPQRRRQIKVAPEAINKLALEYQKTQDQFLCLVLLRPTLRELLGITTEDMFNRETARDLVAFLKANPEFAGKPQEVQELKDLADYVKIETLLYEELYQGLELNDLHYEATRLQARLIEQYVKAKKQLLMQEFDDADDAAMQDLLTQVKAYDALLNQVKGGFTRGQEER